MIGGLQCLCELVDSFVSVRQQLFAALLSTQYLVSYFHGGKDGKLKCNAPTTLGGQGPHLVVEIRGGLANLLWIG